MRIVSRTGDEKLALVYVGKTASGKLIEFVESLEPPYPREKKWVLIISTLFGCPVRCPFCDAGNSYRGKLTASEILEQIEFLVESRFENRRIPSEKFKIQFARMGDPAFNMNVIEAMVKIPELYHAPGFMPSISTIAPEGCGGFFEELLTVKRKKIRGGFQLQFSIHTTDADLRDRLIPVRKWDFAKIASFGERFFEKGDRKIGLNFALEKNSPLDGNTLLKFFDPDIFIIKITPLNPTYGALQNSMVSYLGSGSDPDGIEIADALKTRGYDVLISIGELEENRIGSNCGQFITRHLEAERKMADGYTFETIKLAD